MENISLTNPTVQDGDEVLVNVRVLATAFRALDESGTKTDKRGQQGGAQ
jgi:hypothetical protein